MLLYLSDLGQRSKMHNACSRCDSYMKSFQPSRRDAAPDCLGDHGMRLPGSGRSGDWPAEALTLAAAIDGLDTGRRGGPEPDAITLETFGREIPEA